MRPSCGSGNQEPTALFFRPGFVWLLGVTGEDVFVAHVKWVLLNNIGFTSVRRVLRLFTE